MKSSMIIQQPYLEALSPNQNMVRSTTMATNGNNRRMRSNSSNQYLDNERPSKRQTCGRIYIGSQTPSIPQSEYSIARIGSSTPMGHSMTSGRSNRSSPSPHVPHDSFVIRTTTRDDWPQTDTDVVSTASQKQITNDHCNRESDAPKELLEKMSDEPSPIALGPLAVTIEAENPIPSLFSMNDSNGLFKDKCTSPMSSLQALNESPESHPSTSTIEPAQNQIIQNGTDGFHSTSPSSFTPSTPFTPSSPDRKSVV